MGRRWLFWLLTFIFFFVIVTHFDEIFRLARIIADGQWEWLVGAVLLQAIYYLLYSSLYRSAFNIVEVRSRTFQLFPVIFASLFVNTVAPTGGAAGAALFVDDAAQRGQSPIRAATGTLLVFIAYHTTFTLILAFGLIYLFTHHTLAISEVIGLILFLTTMGTLSALLLFGLYRTDRVLQFFNGIQRLLRRLGGKVRFLQPSEGWAERNAEEFAEASLAIAMHPERSLGGFLLALAVHAANLASLEALFFAFHSPVGFTVLVAGYSVGMLFRMIPFIPFQGIGLVESGMTLVFVSLGVDMPTAVLTSLAFRGLTFWVPMVLGFGLLYRLKTFGAEARTRAEALSVQTISLLTALMGIVNILSAITPALNDRLEVLARFSPLEVSNGSHLTATLAGFALLILAGRLWRRKRMAWIMTLIVLLISVVSHMLKGLDYEEASLALILATWLFFLHPHFHARSDRPSLRQGILILLAAFFFTIAYGVSGFYLLDRHFSVNFGFWAAIRQTLIMFTQFYDPGLQPITGFGRYFAASIYLVGAVTIGYAFLMVTRPVFFRDPATPDERERARKIAQEYGHTSLTRFAMFEDKSFYFTPGGSVVSYVSKGRIGLTLGDPIGPPEDFVNAVNSFVQFCARHDWQPAFYQTATENLPVYKNLGYGIACVGHEGIVDLNSFTLEGNANKVFRTSVNRLTKLGYRSEMMLPPQSSALLHDLRIISDEWLTMMNGTEKRFSLGWFDDNYIGNCPVMLIYSPEGAICAFANLLTGYSSEEVTVDLMRRRREVENGMMDFLFTELFFWAKSQGYQAFNFSLSPLAGVGLNEGDPAVERALYYIYQHLNQFYNFKGLHQFKEKFHPHWEPRFLVYPGPVSLPAVAVALVKADSGDDFFQDILRTAFKKS